MDYEYMIRIYSGRYTLNLENKTKYNEVRSVIKEYKIWLIVTLGISFLWLFSLFYLALVITYEIWYYCFFFTPVIIALCYITLQKMNKYNHYLFNQIINDLLKKGYKISYSNDKTGRITYTKNGIGHSIYVFKGKNAKSAK